MPDEQMETLLHRALMCAARSCPLDVVSWGHCPQFPPTSVTGAVWQYQGRLPAYNQVHSDWGCISGSRHFNLGFGFEGCTSSSSMSDASSKSSMSGMSESSESSLPPSASVTALGATAPYVAAAAGKVGQTQRGDFDTRIHVNGDGRFVQFGLVETALPT